MTGNSSDTIGLENLCYFLPNNKILDSSKVFAMTSAVQVVMFVTQKEKKQFKIKALKALTEDDPEDTAMNSKTLTVCARLHDL